MTSYIDYFKYSVLTFSVLFSVPLFANTLAEDLDRFVKRYIETTPDNVQQDYSKSIDELRDSGILENALSVGDVAPEFRLPNAIGTEISLYDFLQGGPVVIIWYRGGWCPYCNLQLQHIQKKLKDINMAGGQVIAISPELPDKTMTTKERHSLEFQVLSDVNNKVADSFRLAYTVPDYVVDHYDLSITLNEHNGNEAKRLPLAATYIIDKTGVIEYAFLDADYKNRASPDEIITILKELRQNYN